MNITTFFETVLNARLTNPIWSWGAVDSQDRIFLRVWSDQIRSSANGDTVEVFWKNPRRRSAGYNERYRHLEMIRQGAQGFGIVCTARETSDGGREIVGFDDRYLLRLGTLTEDERRVYARVISRLPINEFKRENGLAKDLADILKQPVDATTKRALVDARIGQGRFRADVLELWDKCCCVSGSTTLIAIRASHIKPWRDSTNMERLDPANGLPLVANLDALFDAGLISFDDRGSILVSPELPFSEQQLYNLPGKALRRNPPDKTVAYLAFHRKEIFRH